MNLGFYEYMKEQLPVFNEIACNNFSYHDMKTSVEWLDDMIQCSSVSWPKQFKYLGIRRLTPEESYTTIVNRDASNKILHDVSGFDLFMIEIKFHLENVGDLTKRIKLPFLRPGGFFHLKGSKSVISGVLADRFFSPKKDPDGIFLLFNKSKMTMSRDQYSILKNDNQITSDIIVSPLYQDRSKKKDYDDSKPKMLPILAHYLFTRLGVTETFQKYFEVTPIVLSRNDYESMRDYNHYDEEYVKYTSRGLKPKAFAKSRHYEPNTTVFLIKKEDLIQKPYLESMVTMFFYIVDHFPKEATVARIDDPDHWKVLLAHIIWRRSESYGKSMSRIEEHLASLDSYVDNERRRTIAEEGVRVEDIWDLMGHLAITFSDRIKNSEPGNMWGKYLLVKRYLLSDYLAAINKLTWELDKMKDNITYQKISQHLNQLFGANIHAKINTKHPERRNVQYAGDNKLFLHSLVIIRQDKALADQTGNYTISPKNEGYHLHESVIEVGSAFNYNKPDPDGRARLNPYVKLAPNGKILRKAKFKKLLDQVRIEIAKA